ncbi:hypothetical protein [Frondihabitans cladoniiphilus]|uniref:DUF559 domain-containing protein n=1 Tax=Frondihabitans cladoniiphilus TaxID=715785 RepID=A0ABP8VXA3_9MICO
MIGHRAAVADVAFVHGLPVVGPLAAWVQCGALLGLDELVAVGDALAGRWSPWPAAREQPVDELAHVVQGWGSRRGAGRLREALGLVRANVWSPKETELRLVIVRGGLPEPPWLNRQAGDARGTLLGTPDLAYPEALVAIEYEGDGHRTDRRQWRRDLAKYERFADAGWRVIRVTDDDLAEPCILLSRLEALLRSRAPGGRST